jgi:uncharacterized membrane protein YhhN
MKNSYLKTLFEGLFVVASLVNLVALSYGNNVIASCAKPFLMPFLALTAYFWLKENEVQWSRIATYTMAALVFGTIGDILLIFGGNGFFIAGAIAFFIGHIMYMLAIYAFSRGKRISGRLEETLPVIVGALAMGILLAFGWQFINSFNESAYVKIAIGIYALAFPCNIFFAAYGAVFYKPLWLTAFGYLFFAFSDALIGINVFKNIDFPSRHMMVMLLYIIGQAMIVAGIVKSLKLKMLK